MAEIVPPGQSGGFDNAQFYVWVKALEGKVNNLLREMDILKNDSINKNSQLKKEVKVLSDEVVDLKHEQIRMMQKMDLMIGELQKTAGIEEVLTLRKYVEFWNPLTFATQKDVEKMIDAKMTISQAPAFTAPRQ